jgi:hypothetical protein
VSSRHKERGKRADQTGRTKNAEPRHVRLYEWFRKTEAWRSLSPAERCVYIEIEAAFHGANNGQIGLSARTAAKECRISKDTATKAFATLIKRGFVECTTPGGFSTNSCLAPEWRLTRAPCDVTGDRATMAFKGWTEPLELKERRATLAARRAANVPKRSPKGGTVLSENKDSPKAKRPRLAVASDS